MAMDVMRTTYRGDYRGYKPLVPVIKYKDVPSQQKPACTTPKRRPSNNGNTEGLHPLLVVSQTSTGNNARGRILEDSKPVYVFNTKFGPMDMDTINSIYNNVRFQSCTQKAMAEVHLPTIALSKESLKLEPNSDMIRLRAQKYEDSSHDWQDSVLWDRIQARAPTERPNSPPTTPLFNPRTDRNVLSDKDRVGEISRLAKLNQLSNAFVRQCPGYAGYQSLCPPYSWIQAKGPTETFVSTKESAYRHQTSNTPAVKSKYRRKGEFSKTVTLTFPFNPYKGFKDACDADIKNQSYNGGYIGLVPHDVHAKIKHQIN